MRLRQEDDGGHAVWRKGVAAQVEDGKTTALGCGEESIPNELGIVQEMWFSNPEFRD